MTNTTAASKYIPRRSRISIDSNPTFQTSLQKISKEIFFRLTKFFFRNKNFFSKEQLLFSFLCIVKQKKKFGAIRKYLKIFIYENLLQKKRLKGGISINADSSSYVLWCCGGICHQPDTFIKIGCGHTVWGYALCTLYTPLQNVWLGSKMSSGLACFHGNEAKKHFWQFFSKCPTSKKLDFQDR